MATSELIERISLRLMQDVSTGLLTAGEHLRTEVIATRFDVSRTPVREAFQLLEQRGVLERLPHRGFFVTANMPDAARVWLEERLDDVDSDYQQLSDDWLKDRIPETISEHYIRERYDWTKTRVSDLLARAAREGWAERKDGYGWRLLPVAKTPEAFDAIYRFRMTIEPAALLEPTFLISREKINELRQVQSRMLDWVYSDVHDETLLMNGSSFHEELAMCSGNPYFVNALEQANRMRRLMEYRTEINRERLVEQCTEHLEILDLIDEGQIIDASYRLRQHLSGALKRKSPVAWNWASDVQSV